MKIYLIKRHDGSVCIMHMQTEDATIEGEIAKWPAEERTKVASWREIEAGDIPEDRSQRHAWCDVTPEPKVDIDPAKAAKP